MRLHDRELLLGDVLERRPEPAGVLQPDVREHRDARPDHAGRVIAATKPCLDDRDVDLPAGHLPQGSGCQKFELGHVIILGERSVHALGRPRRARDRRSECVGIDLACVDEHAFAIGDQVGREIGARAQTVAFEDRRGHPRRRGLAVGPEHLDRVESLLGRAEHGHHPPHPVQPEAHPEQLQRAQLTLGSSLCPAAAVLGRGDVLEIQVQVPCRRRPGAARRSFAHAGRQRTRAASPPARVNACAVCAEPASARTGRGPFSRARACRGACAPRRAPSC